MRSGTCPLHAYPNGEPYEARYFSSQYPGDYEIRRYRYRESGTTSPITNGMSVPGVRVLATCAIVCTALLVGASETKQLDAQPPDIAWVRGYSNGNCEAHPHSGVQTADGGYLMVGDSVCYGDASVDGLNRAIYVVKASRTGDEEWSLQVGDVGYNYGKFAIELGDRSVLVVGSGSLVDSAGTAAGYPFVERRVLHRISRDGKLMHSWFGPVDASLDPGLRYGFMCASLSADDNMTVYATGYLGGESGFDPKTKTYDDEPMFLIYGGTAFLTKISFSRDPEATPSVAFDASFPPSSLGADNDMVAQQGMRAFHDAATDTVIVSAASTTNEDPGSFQFSLIAADPASGAVRWAHLYPASDPARNRTGTGSHPYALTLGHPESGGYLLAGLALEATGPVGRALAVAPDGSVRWDTRFRQPGLYQNTECYGVAYVEGYGEAYILTCGTGVEPEDHPHEPARRKTWMVLNAAVRANDGEVLWYKTYTNTSRLQNNAGEYIVSTQDGAAAVYVDSQTWGSASTGGNFGLMKLEQPTRTAMSAEEPRPSIRSYPGLTNIPPGPRPGSLTWPPAPPYNHTVKELGTASSAAACADSCLAYRNGNVSPVSGWTLCQSFTWEEGTGRCVAIVDPQGWEPRRAKNASTVSAVVTWPPRPCSSDAECSYNGVCSRAAARGERLCVCDAAWTGDRCQTLAVRPARREAGLRIVESNGANTSTWGGSVIFDRETNTSHMWAAEMLQHCGIDAWTSNSHVIHATSTDPNGRYVRQSEVVPVFSHEPNVVRAPNGEFVMYYTGVAPGQPAPQPCSECTDGNTPPGAASCGHSPSGNGPTFMIRAKSPYGPWSKPEQLFKSQANFTNLDTNLAVTILADGSVVGIARTVGPPTGVLAHLVTARDWTDPESYVGRWTKLLFPNTTIVDDAGVEDPFVYRDRRGIFHAVFHNQIEADDERLCGGHSYSEDGETWVFTGTSWGNRVRFTDGTEYKFSRRERPHFVFGDPQDPFKITALTTGVQFGTHAPVSVAGEDATYTLLQTVGR